MPGIYHTALMTAKKNEPTISEGNKNFHHNYFKAFSR